MEILVIDIFALSETEHNIKQNIKHGSTHKSQTSTLYFL